MDAMVESLDYELEIGGDFVPSGTVLRSVHEELNLTTTHLHSINHYVDAIFSHFTSTSINPTQ